MVIKIVANLACSFIGTIAYAVMFQVPRRFYIGCGITGSVGWMIYKLASVYCSVAVASFIGTVCTVLVARMLTVRLKCPITIFLISGIITLVPGNFILKLFTNISSVYPRYQHSISYHIFAGGC